MHTFKNIYIYTHTHRSSLFVCPPQAQTHAPTQLSNRPRSLQQWQVHVCCHANPPPDLWPLFLSRCTLFLLKRAAAALKGTQFQPCTTSLASLSDTINLRLCACVLCDCAVRTVKKQLGLMRKEQLWIGLHQLFMNLTRFLGVC